MASEKRLRAAHTRFIKENPSLNTMYDFLISGMSRFIYEIGNAEVSAKIKNSKLICHACR